MNKIEESELIINERGAIYHLNVRPEELAHTVITVGDPDRVAMISVYFDKIEFKNQHREFLQPAVTCLIQGCWCHNVCCA